MRRPLLIIFIFILIYSFIYTKNRSFDKYHENDILSIKGVIKDKKEKEKYNEYTIDKFLVRDYNKNNNILIGDILNTKGKYKSLDNMIFDDFNYGRYIKSIGLDGIIYMESYDILGQNFLYKNIGRLKIYISDTSRYLYKKNSDFINSILLGQRENLSKEQNDIFQRSGTSHIIAISGLHTGILCAIISFLIGGINKFYKLLILFIIINIYMLMVGASPSIVRSIYFITILYLSIFLDKKVDGISTLSIVGIFLVINNPYIIYNTSFQLSFLATLSIIYFYSYINRILKISIISLTISANILTLPIIYYNFKGISIISIIGNLIVVPFIGIIMYLSIVSIFLFNLNIEISKFIAKINYIIVNIIYYSLEKISDLYFVYIEIENPKIYYVIIYYIIIFSYMIYKEKTVIEEQKNELQGYYK